MKHAIIAAGAALLAALGTPALGHGPAKHDETSTPIFKGNLPNVPGKALIVSEVVYPPGGATPAHKHPKSAFIYAYVVSGEMISAVNDEKPRVYRAGESWTEAPGDRHRVSRNASSTEPAKLLAVFVVDQGTSQLVFPDGK
jgi:quercetin dioxygenase-like cupin family protein